MDTHHYWLARFLFYRGLFLTYLSAFLVARHQFIPLAGENGILPFTRLVEERSFLDAPSLFHWFPSDRAVRWVSNTGVVLSLVGLFGVEWLGTTVVALVLLVIWASYLSLVKVGRLFYGYGWESFLCETGALSVFLGGAYTPVPSVMPYLLGWLLFRVMFGAGLIKIRADQCWRDLTCLDYHYETQPMPNPLSWFAHHLPSWWHKLEVAGNHVTELVVPFLYFAPHPYAAVGAILTLAFQGWLMLTGNFSWLNFLTIVVSIPLIPDGVFPGWADTIQPAMGSIHPVHQYATWGFALVVIVLSYYPAKNLISSNQLMNAGFDPFNLVNTYGAFGSITKTRNELVVQGRREGGEWKTYEFKGKPTAVDRCPPQWAPYHLRLDWQMWFAAMRPRPRYWMVGMLDKILRNDSAFTSLLHRNPFEGTDGPDEVRVQRFQYEYTDPGEWWETGHWWKRRYVDQLFRPMDHDDVKRMLR
jgi:hypothetical protein